MVKKKNISDKEKTTINNRHIAIYNKALDGIEFILDGVMNDLAMYDDTFLELPKPVISALDFVVSALTKLQKGQRLALGLDNEVVSDEIEPQISIIEGVDIHKV
jgi:hypothetical protein